MMMAHQSGNTPPRLAEETLAGVRDALGRSLDGGAGPDELRDALRALSREARERGMRAEQILVVLKELWTTVPQVRRTGGREQEGALLQRAVTLCINEYYAG